MMTLLAVVGGLIGLAVTGAAVWLAWSLYAKTKVREEADTTAAAVEAQATFQQRAVQHLMKWTFFDYALLALFIIGSLFLFTDLITVLQDAEAFPPYHYAYLLCGFVFTLTGTLMMAVRLALTVSLGRTTPNHHDQPSHAEHSE